MRRRIHSGDDADRAYDPHAPWIGANFWSRSGGPRMWTHYDGAVVRQELATLAEHGCNVTRSFCYWPDFVPAPERLDEDVLDRFADFLAAHVEIGLGTIPTFLVGHMSGENWTRRGAAAGTSTATSGWSLSRPGSRRRSHAATGSIQRWPAGSSRTRCRSMVPRRWCTRRASSAGRQQSR